MAVGMPASVLYGIFVGLQRNEIPALIVGGSRLTAAVGVVLAGTRGFSLSILGAVTGFTNLAGCAVAYWLYRGSTFRIHINPRLFNPGVAKELAGYSYSLMVWSLSMLLISGLDLTIVGLFDYHAVPYYAAANSLVIFVAGTQNAIFSAFMPVAAVLDARRDAQALGRMLISTTRYSTLVLLITGIPLIIYSRPLLNMWVGPAYASHGVWLLRVLVAANMVRLTATPYAVVLIGTGQQRLVTVSPLVEGIINLLASVVGAKLVGAIGVAAGTALGAVFCVIANLLYNMPRTVSVQFRIREYLRDGIAMPSGCMLMASLSYLSLKEGGAAKPVLALLMILLTLWFTWRIVMSDGEKQFCKRALRLHAFSA
jgi:O-antigen/teichoic acid export membrane protein